MSEEVRMNVDGQSLPSSPSGDTFLDGSGAETTSVAADEDGSLVYRRH
jgi:hypothetical protein